MTKPAPPLRVEGASTTGHGFCPVKVVTPSGRTFALAFDELDANRIIRQAAQLAAKEQST